MRLPCAVSTRELEQWLKASGEPHRLGHLNSRWGSWAPRALVSSGAAVSLVPGVIAHSAHAGDPRVRGLALALWHPLLHVTGSLALHLIAPQLQVPTVAHVVVPYGVRLAAVDGVVVWQRARILTSQLPQGVRTVSGERALIDAWQSATDDTRHTVVYEALWARVSSARAALRELDRMPRVRGRDALRRLLESVRGGSTSPLEAIARTQVFTGSEWKELEWQAPIEDADTFRRADALHRRARVLIEFDGQKYHGSPQARERDRKRDIELAAAGYLTLRFTHADLTQRPEWCRAVVRRVVSSRIAVL
jgi:very-short-patch-repair endonuclease